MGFLERVEVTIYMLPIIAFLTGAGFAIITGGIGVFIAWALGTEIITTIKLGSLAGFLTGTGIGTFTSLAYLFKKASSEFTK